MLSSASETQPPLKGDVGFAQQRGGTLLSRPGDEAKNDAVFRGDEA